MTLVSSRQVSEFKSDTIQTTSENCALPTKRHFLNSFCDSSKLSSALSAPPLTLAMLESENRRITQKESCVLLEFCTLRRALSQRKKKGKSARAGSTPGRTCISLSSNEVKRGHMVLPLSNHLDNHVCVCDSLSMSLLPDSWPPCQPPLPTTAAQLRCDLRARPS
jgi:hypothetical protein